MALLSHEGLPILIDIVCVFRYLSEKLYTIIESKLECTSGQTESSNIVVCHNIRDMPLKDSFKKDCIHYIYGEY